MSLYSHYKDSEVGVTKFVKELKRKSKESETCYANLMNELPNREALDKT